MLLLASKPHPSGPKFLLDENVRQELFIFLQEKGVDVKRVGKGLSAEQLKGKIFELTEQGLEAVE